MHWVPLLSFFFVASRPQQQQHPEHPFIDNVQTWLSDETIPFVPVSHLDAPIPGTPPLHPCCALLNVSNAFLLHLIPTPDNHNYRLSPTYTKGLTETITWTTIVHLHETIWNHHGPIVQNRLLQKCGRYQRYYGRHTKVERLSKPQAVPFLQQHHLWGPTNVKFYYGLVHNKRLVAVAAFTSKRTIQRGSKQHRSFELTRYCSVGVVVGGISKLMAAFVRLQGPDDIITVVDRDWGRARNWNRLGFETVQVMPPLPFIVKNGVRHNLVRRGGADVVDELDRCPMVYDSGMERLMMVVNQTTTGTAIELWNDSIPRYPSSYYSQDPKIQTMLNEARDAS